MIYQQVSFVGEVEPTIFSVCYVIVLTAISDQRPRLKRVAPVPSGNVPSAGEL
jgi:hypothetical protein